MAGQSITFDFLTTGSDRTASGFRKVGDNAALASRGAKVLSDVIEKLGAREDRTAAESKILATALKQTGTAEDRMTAKTVLADAAIRRLDDAMKDSKKSSGELGKTLGGLKLNPGFLGPALLLAPAITTLGGVAVAAAAGLAGAFAAGGIALGAFGAVAKPVLTSALTASKAVNTAQQAYQATLKAGVPTAQAQATLQAANASAQLTYTAALKGGAKPAAALAAYHLALAKNQLAYNKATNAGVFAGKAYAAEQAAISKAYAGMSPQQIALSRQLGAMANAWAAVKAAQTPVVSGALQPWLQSVTSLTKQLGPIVQAVSPVIGALGAQFNAIVTSSSFTAFRDFIANTGSRAVGAAGNALLSFIQAFIILLPKFQPLIQQAVTWLGNLGPAVEKWAASKKTADDITKFMAWFTQNGPQVGTLLGNIAGALKAMAPGLTSGGLLELQAISAFMGYVAKLPPGVAKPLFEVAGALLVLKKLGVFSVGIKLVGLGSAASGAAPALAGLSGPLALAGAGIGGGFILAVKNAIQSGWKGVAGILPGLFGGVGGILQTSATGWTSTIIDHFATPVRGAWASLGHFMASSFDATRHQVSGIWDKLTGDSHTATTGIAGQFTHMSAVIAGAIQQTGRATDALRTRNLVPLLGEAGRVSGGIQGLASRITPGLTGALNTGGAHVNSFRSNNLGPLQGSLSSTSGGVRGLQGLINAMHGKNVQVGVHASGSGGMTFTEKVAASISSGGFSLRSLAAGGRLPGYGGGDRHPALLESGETVVSKEHSKTLAGAFRSVGVPGYASGGIAGMVPWAANAGYGFAQAAESDLLRKEFAHLKATVAAAAKANALANASPAAGGVPGSGVARWRGTVQSALAQLGLSLGLANDVLYQMQTESGGNPTIVNTTDSNWLAGHPSVGLMQVIAGTFAAYAGQYRTIGPFEYGVSVNPLANIYAALNYAKHGRGFGSGPGQIGSGHGYDQGGWLMPGVTMAVNNTGRPEQVLPPGRSGSGRIVLEFRGSGHGTFDAFLLKWIQEHVRVRGGTGPGAADRAFGHR